MNNKVFNKINNLRRPNPYKIAADLQNYALFSGRQHELNFFTDRKLALRITKDVKKAMKENKEIYQ